MGGRTDRNPPVPLKESAAIFVLSRCVSRGAAAAKGSFFNSLPMFITRAFQKMFQNPPHTDKVRFVKGFPFTHCRKKIDVKPPPHSTLKTSCTVRDCSEKNLKKKSATKYQFDPAEVTGGTGVCYEGSF